MFEVKQCVLAAIHHLIYVQSCVLLNYRSTFLNGNNLKIEQCIDTHLDLRKERYFTKQVFLFLSNDCWGLDGESYRRMIRCDTGHTGITHYKLNDYLLKDIVDKFRKIIW